MYNKTSSSFGLTAATNILEIKSIELRFLFASLTCSASEERALS